MNLNSHKQVKDYLLSQGWIPDTWNINKETRERTSPKLTESSFDTIQGDLGQLLAKRNVLRHRRNTLKNFKDPTKGLINLVRADGTIPADANTCATNTARYAHKGAYCNIPSNYAILGTEVRKCYVAKKWRVLVGCDLSGIEMRGAAHFAYPYDQGKLMEMVLHGDFHQEQADNVYGCSRNLGKSVTYCLLYGGGAAKAASILGCTVKRASQLIKLFWDFNEGLGKLKKDLEKSFKRNRGYIVNIDNRKTFVRAEYRLLNTLLQSSCAIIFKRWLLEIDKGVNELQVDTQHIASYHDDCLHDCCPDEVARLSKVFQDSIDITRARYNIVPKLDIDTMVGMSLDEVH